MLEIIKILGMHKFSRMSVMLEITKMPEILKMIEITKMPRILDA